LEDPGGGPGELVLFVVPAPGHVVDDELRRGLASEVRRSLSPRHVPDRIVAVSAVPRTLSGKKLEVPVKKILQGADPQTVASPGSLANPGSLAEYQRATIDR
jgi:acetoacetyl-CoA synthetase